jgi:hypothetical protein
MAKSEAEKTLDDQEKARLKANADAQKLMDEAQPTPTQRENDLARLGQLDIDNKEADGSPEDTLGVQTRDLKAGEPAAYKTK